jgi:two-component system NtrC family sensor kinase
VSGPVESFPPRERPILDSRGILSLLSIPIRTSEKWYGQIIFHDTETPREWREEDVRLLRTAADMLGNFFDRKRVQEERERLQLQLYQSEKLSTIGTFISSIAHELNNPLTSVLAYSELILDKEVTDSEELLRDLSILQKEAKRSASIVKNLLSFSRKQRPVKEDFLFNNLILGVVDLKAYQLRVEGIRVETDFETDLPPFYGNPNQLQQVLLNLITNAEQKFLETGEKGKITLRTRNLGNWIRIEVEDSGAPIPEEILPEIFNPFFTTKDPDRGTGLGLSVCFEIMAENGGCIYAENLDRGVRFTLQLPLTSKEEMALEEDRPDGVAVDGSDWAVLVVDDEETIVSLVEKLLRKNKFRVETARSGTEALQILESKKIDLVISDVKMPDINGLDLAKKIFRIQPALSTRYIFMSGSINFDRDEVSDPSPVVYLQKPFGKNQLLQTIRDILRPPSIH